MITIIDIILAIAIVVVFVIHSHDIVGIEKNLDEFGENTNYSFTVLFSILLYHLGIDASSTEEMEENISRIVNYINKERNNRQEEMTETVKIKRHRQAKSQLEQIYDPNLRNSIEDFYKALDEFMEDCPDMDVNVHIEKISTEDQENDAF